MTSDVALTGVEQQLSLARQPAGDRLQMLHDLRQPVALMRILLTDVADRPDVPTDVADKIAQVNGQVAWLAEMLTQSGGRPDHVTDAGPCGAPPRREPTRSSPSHLTDVLGAVVDSFATTHPGRLTLEESARPWVPVPSTSLRRALTNLIDNAVRVAGPDGVVKVRAGVTGRRAFVIVEDDGPGFTLSRGLPTFGLGIAIEIAAAAGGSLEIGAGTLGGTSACFRVPTIRTRPDGGAP